MYEVGRDREKEGGVRVKERGEIDENLEEKVSGGTLDEWGENSCNSGNKIFAFHCNLTVEIFVYSTMHFHSPLLFFFWFFLFRNRAHCGWHSFA